MTILIYTRDIFTNVQKLFILQTITSYTELSFHTFFKVIPFL